MGRIITLFTAFYLIAGAILSTIYCLLAGWSFIPFMVLIILLPACVVGWIFIAEAAGYSENGYGFKKIDPSKVNGVVMLFRYVFWVYTILLVLPIIMRVASGIVAHDNVSLFLYSNRYIAPLAIVIIAAIKIACILLIYLAYIWVKYLIYLKQRKAKFALNK